MLICITIPAGASTTPPQEIPAENTYHADIERMLERAGIATTFILVVSDDTILSVEGYGKTTPADILGIDKKREYEIATEKTLTINRLSSYLNPDSFLSFIQAYITGETSGVEMTGSFLPGITKTMTDIPWEIPDTSLLNERGDLSRAIRVSQPVMFSFKGYAVIDQSYTFPGVRILVTKIPEKNIILLIIVSEDYSPIPEAVRARILDAVIS